MSFIREPRLFFCIGNVLMKPDGTGVPRWLLQFQPVIALSNEPQAPMTIQTTQEATARSIKVGSSYIVHDTDEGNGMSRRHIEPGEPKLMSLPAFKDR